METITNKNSKLYNDTSELLLPHLEEIITSKRAYDQKICIIKLAENADLTLDIRIITWIKRHVWNLILSPSVLLCSLLIYTAAPLKIFKQEIKSLVSFKLNMNTKRLFDILGALIGLILCSVLFPIISILIKLDSKGPVFYTQVRVGQNRRKRTRRKINADINIDRRKTDRRKNNLHGKSFVIYKFRTMREDAEKKCGPVWASKNDPRVTPLGKILRRTHLDEIPQLINILKGDMSFVGPRPERPYFVNQLAAKIPDYSERLNVKPGLTGLAQIYRGYDDSIESVTNKLTYDLQYCQNGTFYSYLKILSITVFKTILGKTEM